MEKEFVPYDRALRLKALGFNEPCFGYYNNNNEFTFFADVKSCNTNTEFGFFPTVPTFSQAFRWFREKYGLRNSITDFIDDEKGIEWDYEIVIIGTDLDERGNYKPLVDYSTDDETRKFKTYEEAELSCLDKLIEIVEEINKEKNVVTVPKINLVRDFFVDHDNWENSFSCDYCGANSINDFAYIRSVANGECWNCLNCRNETMVEHEPNQNDY